MDGGRYKVTETSLKLSTKLSPVVDKHFLELKYNWYKKPQINYSKLDYIRTADEWFKSTKRNNLLGWEEFPYVDATMGCTHYIESIVIKYGWDGFQILPDEYAYYGLMGKFGTEPGNLEPNKPLMISLPSWRYGDLYAGWDDILKECEKKNIDIHIDMAWITTSKDITLDLSHPNIKSFAMSLSKYNLQWNRVGLRWTRQRGMDNITMFNHYYGDVNTGLMSCGVYMMKNIPRDYIWDKYGEKNLEVCKKYNLISTNILHLAKKPNDDQSYGIAHLILGQ